MPELIYNGEPIDIVYELDLDVYEAQYPHTDRAFIVTRDEITVAADWE